MRFLLDTNAVIHIGQKADFESRRSALNSALVFSGLRSHAKPTRLP